MLDASRAQILLVDYKDCISDNIQVRVPGGKFQIKDLLDAIDGFFTDLSESEPSRRILDLDFFPLFVNSLWEKYIISIKGEKDIGNINNLFDEVTNKILLEFQQVKGLTEDEFLSIIKRTHQNTYKRAYVSSLGEFFFASHSIKGQHHKFFVVSLGSDAPDICEKLPDPKILKSYWEDMTPTTVLKVFNGHKNGVEAGIRLLVEKFPKGNALEKFDIAKY